MFSVVVEFPGAAPALTDLTAKEFLLRHASGAYTTARTVNRKSVFEFDTHIARLVTSLGRMTPPVHTDVAAVERLMVPMVVAALQTYISADPQGREMKVTMLMHDLGEKGASVHVSDLFEHSSTPCVIDVHGAPRSNPAAKDSQWVRDRQSLEQLKSPDANDMVLQDDLGRLYEGLQSNFFVVLNDRLVTAPEGSVLRGTVQSVVLQVAKENGIPVDLDFPRLVDAPLWSGAFLTGVLGSLFSFIVSVV